MSALSATNEVKEAGEPIDDIQPHKFPTLNRALGSRRVGHLLILNERNRTEKVNNLL
jgi:hypothetical protein